MSEIKFNKGQSVQPAFEGWMKNPDGSYSLWFGYLNRNYQETPDVPIGPTTDSAPAVRIWDSRRISCPGVNRGRSR